MTSGERPAAMDGEEMARPKKDADTALSETLLLRLTVASRETLETRARAASVTPQDFLRRYVDGVSNPSPARSAVDPSLVAALNSYAVALGKIGNNVNQLAAATHQGRDFSRYWREIGDELQADLKAARDALAHTLEAMDE